MPDNQVNLVYKLDGDVGEIDVFKLAPCLLALGALIQDSNRELNPAGRQIAVNVKPFRPGSFIVELVLFPSTHLQQVLDLLNSHPAEQIKNLLEWIGLITGSGGGVLGLVQLLKWLGGRPKTVEQLGPGEYRYTAGDDRSITVKAPVHQLFSNSTITNNVYQVYVAPMEGQSSVEDIKTYIENEPASAVTVARSDVPVIRESVSPSPTLADVEETTKETLHSGVFLNPKRGAFGDDPKDWSFWRGGDVLTATIRDRGFLSKVASGEYRLNQSDLLVVDLLERQKIKGTLVQKPTYEITKVTEYRKAESQSLLFGPSGPA